MAHIYGNRNGSFILEFNTFFEIFNKNHLKSDIINQKGVFYVKKNQT